MIQTWLNLFLTFSKIGVLGYGGGPAMLPLIQEEVVEGHTWMTDEDFIDTLAMGNTLPGPIATIAATALQAQRWRRTMRGYTSLGRLLPRLLSWP